MKTISLALTVSRIRFATVVFPEPVPPEMPMIKLTMNSMLEGWYELINDLRPWTQNNLLLTFVGYFFVLFRGSWFRLQP
jgi:hypothetical protein